MANGSDGVTYDREVLINTLIYHYRKDISGCGCGWADLGASHPKHVADVYEESVKALNESSPQANPLTCSCCEMTDGIEYNGIIGVAVDSVSMLCMICQPCERCGRTGTDCDELLRKGCDPL